MSKTIPIKLVLVGDGFVGKTSLIIAYTSGNFRDTYVPTVADNCSHDISVDGKSIKLSMYDSAGQEDYDRLRPLSYKDTNVFLVCYSVDGRNSYRNVRDTWMPELRHYGGIGVPVVLVATKTDLRDDRSVIEDLKRQNATLVSTKEGDELAREIGASRFVECSSRTLVDLDKVFTEAVRAHFAAQEKCMKKPKPHCSLL